MRVGLQGMPVYFLRVQLIVVTLGLQRIAMQRLCSQQVINQLLTVGLI